MKVAIGAPVAERAWILNRWFQCLDRQTVRPSEFCFVYSHSTDGTLALLKDAPAPTTVVKSPLPFYPRDQRNDDPADKCRAKHFSKLRNHLRTLLLATDADVLLSLDTDILLEDEYAIERLVDALDDFDMAAPLTYLHPGGELSECYNAGFWTAGDPGSFTRGWRRADKNDVLAYRSPIKIDVPMACVAMRRHALAMCKYKPHECGEDLGFADSIDQHDLRVGWLTDLPVRHVMAELPVAA